MRCYVMCVAWEVLKPKKEVDVVLRNTTVAHCTTAEFIQMPTTLKILWQNMTDHPVNYCMYKMNQIFLFNVTMAIHQVGFVEMGHAETQQLISLAAECVLAKVVPIVLLQLLLIH